MNTTVMEAIKTFWPSIPSLRSNSVSSLHILPVSPYFSTVGYHSQLHVTVKVNATAGKGFGKIIDKKSKTNATGIRMPEVSVCPCGGGDLKLGYEKCCKPYHDGTAIEADATTLMKARFTAYANGTVDYIVNTTHPQNPDFQGADQLADDVRATCARLLFTKLEILNSENMSENEACVLFRVTYLSRNGKKGDKNFLVEKSLFLQEGERWFYREKLPLTTSQMESTNTNFVQAEIARKASNSKKSLQNAKSRKN